jgi:hypothetical protein
MQSVIFVIVKMQPVLQKIILFFLVLGGHFASAQVKFSASLTPAEIGRDEYTQLKLMVENANEVQQITPPDLRNFTLISGPNQESGMTMINGAVKKYIALSFILKPKTTGNFSIGAATAKADGSDYKSNPVKLTVTSQPSGNSAPANSFNSPFGNIDPFAEPAARSAYNDFILRKGENPAEKIKKNMFVRAEVDKQSVYVGEPMVATYKLYTRLKSESNMTKNPSFNGFSVVDMQPPNDMSYRVEKFGGREYNVYILRKVQLYPLLAGNLELGIAEIDNNVQFIKAEYMNQQADVFNDMFRDFADATVPPEGIDMQKVSLQSKPLNILVKPLPEAGKPAGFKGAVGKFAMEAKVEKANITTDDVGRMAVIISGEGNLQMINAPEIAWPQGVEGFESKATDDLYKGTVPVSGRKIFEFPFTVSQPGSYTLPAVEFSFFDAHDATYKSVSTKPVEITVAMGTGKPKNIITSTTKKTDDNLLTKFFNNRLRVVSIVAALIIIGLIFWLKRDSKKERQIVTATQVEEKVVEMAPEAVLPTQDNPLTLTGECLLRDDAGLFYTHLNQELKNYLSKKLAIPAEEINRKNIAEQLDAKGIGIETAVNLQQLIDEIEWELYTPLANTEKMKGMYDRATELVQLIETYRS